MKLLLMMMIVFNFPGIRAGNYKVSYYNYTDQDTITDPLINRNCDITFSDKMIFFKQSNLSDYSTGKVVVNVQVRKGSIDYWEIGYLKFYKHEKLAYIFRGKEKKTEKYPKQVVEIIDIVNRKMHTGKVSCKNLSKSEFTYLRIPFTLLPAKTKNI